MSLDELLEFLRTRLRDPRDLVFYLWIVWLVWTRVRAWLRRRAEQGAEQSQAPAPIEAPAPPPRTPPQPAPAAGRRAAEAAPARERPASLARGAPRQAKERADGPWARALERAHALRQRAGGDRALRRLEPLIVEEVIDPLQSELDQAGRAQPDPHVGERAMRAALALDVLERVVRERAHDENRARLAEVDAVTDACHAPLRHYAQAEGLGLRGLHPVAIRAPLPHAASTPDWNDKLLLVPVPAGFGSRLDDYTTVLHELGRRWYFGLPGLPYDLPAQLGLPPRMRLLEVREDYDRASIQACFGPWLPSLFADTALTLRLGAGYVAGLRKSMAADAHVTRAQADGAFLSSRPPALLRLQAALGALSALGRHDAAEHHRKAFAGEHEALESSYLPLADGRVLVLDSIHLLEFTDLVSRVVLYSPQPGLGGVPLTEVPGLSQSLEDEREQQSLAHAIAHKWLPSRPDAVQLLCGALLACDAGVDPELALAQLHQALSPRATHDTPAARAVRATEAPRSLRAAFRDRGTLRSAIVLGAAFERPRSQRSRS